MAGRVVLTKAIIQALPMYTMQVTAILKPTLYGIEKYDRVFVWGHELNEKKLHMVS